ncbi:XTP/dITP diphosphatase [candidate division KSB1 bacterium]|nr:XTP/dITP diphosphatase [candidate division KSB1 bacterium]
MISKLVLATRNSDKVREILQIIGDLPISVLDLNQFPFIPEIIETGLTFEANAILKAQTVFSYTGLPALADDSGLEVAFLNGQPGVYSSRFAGPRATAKENNTRLLSLMQTASPEQRHAQFRCVMALQLTPDVCQLAEGSCAGTILTVPRGDGGFGYDPLFWVPEYGQTFAEIPGALKNQISHRGKALRQIAAVLQSGRN